MRDPVDFGIVAALPYSGWTLDSTQGLRDLAPKSPGIHVLVVRWKFADWT